jgi:ribonuclease-3
VGTVTPAGKISAGDRLKALVDALDAVLNDDPGPIWETIGDEAIGHALTLRDQAKLYVDDRSDGGSSPQPTGSAQKILASLELVPGLEVSAWKSSMIPKTRPFLPAILDPTLAAGAFIHQGFSNGRVNDVTYERLEWIGDAYIYLLSALLISKTFPSLLPGKCSQLRERLVKNVTLADYARYYGFAERAQLPESFHPGSPQPAKDQDRTKVMGDIFEAYVAAVILSDPANGLKRATAWLKDLWGMTLRKEIIQQEKSGYTMDSPLWNLRGANGLDDPTAATKGPPPNPKEKLQSLIGSKGTRLEYKDVGPVKKDDATKLPLFTVGVYLTGWGVKDKQLGTGTANGKKDAGMKAADMALKDKKLMSVYVEKKRIFQAQMELERQALEEESQAGT